MALVLAARFHTLSEAEVAASMLRSAGIVATIADAHYGSVFWMEQKALGGFRLNVAEEDLADTLALLSAPPPPEQPDDEIDEPMSGGQRVLAAGLGLTLGPAAGWLATSRGGGSPLSERLIGALMALGLLVALGGAVVLISKLLLNPP